MQNAIMPNVTVRNVPEPVRRAIAERAARHGQSMQEYLLGELMRMAQRPTMTEVLDRVRARVKATGTHFPSEAIVEIIRERRGELP